MVFYFLAYKPFLESRQTTAFTVGASSRKVNIDGVNDVNSLMSLPGRPIEKVHFKNGSSTYPIKDENLGIRQDESLGETLNRLKSGQSPKEFSKEAHTKSRMHFDRLVLRSRSEQSLTNNQVYTSGEEYKGHVETCGKSLPAGMDSSSPEDQTKIKHPTVKGITNDGKYYHIPPLKTTCMRVHTLEESVQAIQQQSSDTTSSTVEETPELQGPCMTEEDQINRKKVHFSKVEIRHYKQCLGDNPACHMGPAISLSWKYSAQTEAFAVDEYEALRNHGLCQNRCRLSADERQELLLQIGYSHKDLLRAIVQKRKCQIMRERTIHSLKFSHLEERLEIKRRHIERSQSFACNA